MPDDFKQRLVASPACVPKLSLDEVFAAYSGMGLSKFEAFTSWAAAALDLSADPETYREQAARHGLRFTSMHLPAVASGAADEVKQAVEAARFAQRLGAGIVLFKAKTRPAYIEAAKPFLDAIDREAIDVIPVLQNHKGSAVSSLEDVEEVLDGVNDERLKVLLEVGHFARAGVSWRLAADRVGAQRIAFVHVNEIDREGRSVPYGQGDVDFAGLLKYLRSIDYRGDIVVELELATRDADPQGALREVAHAVDHLLRLHAEQLS